MASRLSAASDTQLCSVAICILLFLGVQCAVSQRPSQSKLQRSRQLRTEVTVLSAMFVNYDANSRPPVRDSASHPAIVVTTSLVLNRVVWHTHSAEVDLSLRQEWEDSRLVFEVDPREDVHEVLLPKNQVVWRPDTSFVGAQEQAPAVGVKAMERGRTIIETSGYVRSEDRRTLRANFHSDGGFPVRDKRTIKLQISSATYPMEDVVYLWANSPPVIQPIQVADHLHEGGGAQYVFEEAEAGECLLASGNMTAGSFSCIELIVRFRASSARGLLSTIIPSALLVFVSWFHFWVHSSWSVPRTLSAAVPFLIFVCLLLLLPIDACGLRTWLLLCTVFTLFSLIEYFLVIRCYTTVTTKATRIATLQRHSRPITPIEQHNHHLPQHGDHDEVVVKGGVSTARTSVVITQDEPLIPEVELRRHGHNKLDIVSRIAFPVAFLIAVCFFVLFYLYF